MCGGGAGPSVAAMTSNTTAPLRTALITGASRGLGLALAHGLAAEGYTLIVDGRDPRVLDEAVTGLPPGTLVHAIAGDVTDPAHRAALHAAAAGLGGIGLLINNAGTLGAHPLPALADYPLGELRAAVEANLIAPLALTQLLLPSLRENGGAVLNVTSDAAVEAYAGWGGYGAVKAALEQASHVLAAEENTVRVWWVDPGDIRTRMHQDAFPDEDISDRPLPQAVVPGFVRLIAERLPSGRYRAGDLLPVTAAPDGTRVPSHSR